MATAAPELADRTLPDDELERMDRYWRAANYLSVGQIYLLDNPLLREPLTLEHIKPRLLGHWGTTPRSEFHLRPHEQDHPEPRPGRHLRVRAGARRAGHGRERVPRGDVQRALLGHLRRRRGDEAAVQAVLVPRRDPEPRRTGGARVDPRGRRARICRLARLRRGVRQPRPVRHVHRRRRRGRDGPAGGLVALEQVPGPGARRCRAADPAPERIQDRQPDPARAHRSQGAREPVRRIRLPAALRRG